jgi:hypothetical protein
MGEAGNYTAYRTRRNMMEEKKREERKDEIVVLDEGIDPEAMATPNGLCCTGSLTPFRS